MWDSFKILPWHVSLQGPDAKRMKYAVDSVHYTDEISETLKKLSPEIIYLLEGTNSDRWSPNQVHWCSGPYWEILTIRQAIYIQYKATKNI